MVYSCGIAVQSLYDWYAGVGISWDTMWDTSADASDASFGALLCMIGADILIYGILTWYLDKVVPQEYGVPLKPWFPFKRSYWCPSDAHTLEPSSGTELAATANTMQENKNAEDIEPCLEPIGSSGVQTINLSKVYDTPDGPKVAVSSLSVEFCEGDITALLGHNGAGKSSTISMLIGVVPCSSGDAVVAGRSIVTELEQVRDSLGVCPQHDVLFHHLTVEEHLWLFAKLKGTPSALVRESVDQMVLAVDLEAKRHVQAFALSGGMKRKLSVGIALIAGSPTVFLDEPSSGMDPAARRSLWDLLRQSRCNRTLVLTTHFMDEADVLGDRIAILAHGHLRCCGSSMFLKQRFGVGYTLTMVSCNSGGAKALENKVVSTVRSIIDDDVQVLSSAGAELVMQLPLGVNPRLVSLFACLEERKVRGSLVILRVYSLIN